MKKIITFCLILCYFLMGGLTIEAKTINKKKSRTSKSKVIGKFKEQDSDLIVFLHANGSVTTTYKCYTGGYEKKDGGQYYTLYYASGGEGNCGEGELIFLITGNDVYYIDGGSADYINNFIYYPNKEIIKVILDESYQNEKDWLEENEYRGFTSLEIPLSKFEKVGTITWIK